MVSWENCISHDRAGRKSKSKGDRSQFQVDYDRLIFSSPFRRLQNKTQVFPLPGNIFVHNRLTHSLEVASVGRSLGNIAGNYVVNKYAKVFSEAAMEFYKYDLANVISAACLAHDIGNPAFGHSGEEAICSYFKEHASEEIEGQALQAYFNEKEWTDLVQFEGNANSLHILTQNLKGRLGGGFWMTNTTLASIAKYPCESIGRDKRFLHRKKFGFFQSEKEIFQNIASSTRMIEEGENPLIYKRHPFVFLVEAADDICYRIIDLEDAHRLKILTTSQVAELFFDLIQCNPQADLEKINRRFNRITDTNEKMAYLRALSISYLISLVATIFIDHEQEIILGQFNKSLIDCADAQTLKALEAIDTISFHQIYKHQSVVELEIAGYHVLSGLLDLFVPALLKSNKRANDKNLIRLIPDQFMMHSDSEHPYQRTFCAIDFVSGMTDIYAVELYKKIKGISIGLS